MRIVLVAAESERERESVPACEVAPVRRWKTISDPPPRSEIEEMLTPEGSEVEIFEEADEE